MTDINPVLIGGPAHMTAIPSTTGHFYRVKRLKTISLVESDTRLGLEQQAGIYMKCTEQFYIWGGWMDELTDPIEFRANILAEGPEQDEVLDEAKYIASLTGRVLQMETLVVRVDPVTEITSYSVWGCIPHELVDNRGRSTTVALGN